MLPDTLFRFLGSPRPATRPRSRLFLERLETRALPSFLAPRGFDVGTTPESVAEADFNSDGRPDLAAANRSSNNVSVLLGNGDGTFQAPRHFATGATAISVAVGDFNRDSRPDLAVTTGGPAPNVSVLLGNGDGTFQAARPFDPGHIHFSVAVADFNGDTIADLATGSQCDEYKCSGSSVRVLLGNGDGTFQATRAAAVAFHPISVAVGDFNGDTHLDVAMVDERGGGFATGAVNVLLGRGDGTLGPPRAFDVGVFPESVAVGEFNGDGRPDLAVANFIPTGTVSVLLGNGDGTFQAARNFAAGYYPGSLAVEDFNRDDRLDLAVANGGGVSVLPGNGDGTFQAAQLFAASSSFSVAAEDVNGDGRLDLVLTSATVRVLLGNGDGTFQTTHVSYLAAGSTGPVALGDFNGDTLLDAATANQGSSTVSILLNAGPPATVERIVLGDGSSQRSRVTSVTVTFSTGVTLAPGAFALAPLLAGAPAGVVVTTSLVGGRTVATLTFAGAGVTAGSLADGIYALVVRGDLVRDAAGRALDGDGDGTPGGDRIDVFFRLFGDGDGDGDVDDTDLIAFAGTYGLTTGDEGFLTQFDADGSGVIDALDLIEFLVRYLLFHRP